VADKLVDFFEGVFVEEKQNSFACSQLPFGLLPFQAFPAASKFGGPV
jgi:hypothetical protein